MRIKCLLCFFLASPVFASYETGPTGDNLTGTFSVAIDYPVTMGLWVKRVDWPASSDFAIILSEDTTNENQLRMFGQVVEDRVGVQSSDSTGTAGAAAIYNFVSAGEYDNVWVCIVAVFASASSRVVYIEDSTNTGSNTTTRTTDNVLDLLTIGTNPGGTSPFADSLVAEPAVWNSALGATDVDAYCSGTPASSIDSANLLGYWPVDTDQATHSDQSGNSGPSLSENGGIVFNADHPVIQSAGAAVQRRRRM